MKVAAFCHFYPPFRMAGSEVVIHELMKATAAAGHEVVAWNTHKTAAQVWRGKHADTDVDGVRVVRVGNPLLVKQHVMRWKPDVIVTHHQHATLAISTARLIKARSVFLTHNNFDINRRPLRARPDLVVYNSDWVRDSLVSKFGAPKEHMTFHPPLTPDRHKVDKTGEALTLVNMNKDKGANLFYDLAQAEPDRRFIGVVGGHGEQVIRRLPNVEIMDHHPDMKRVWAETRVLLMPSVQESYGLVAVEAGLNGIPTIAHPTDGLKENLGAGGLFADRDSVSEWRIQLDYLDHEHHYWLASTYAKERAGDALKETDATLKKWVEWVA